MLLTGIVSYLLFRRKIKKAKEKAQKTKLELQSIQSQLNPHFVFNALNSIQYLVNKDEKSAATTYLNELSTLMRISLYNHEKELIPLKTELQILESYIKLEQLRFHFQYKIIVDENMDVNSVSIPSLLIQPVVENAIKHGVGILEENGFLEIFVEAKMDDMLIRIKDNGQGFDVSKNYPGFGRRLVQQRIDILHQNYQISSRTESSEKGTIVDVSFKNWL